MADAVRLYGPHAVLKDVGLALLEYGCQARCGRAMATVVGRIGRPKEAKVKSIAKQHVAL